MRCYICDADSVTVVWNEELGRFDACDVCLEEAGIHDHTDDDDLCDPVFPEEDL